LFVAWVADDAGCDGRAIMRPKTRMGEICQASKELSSRAAIEHRCRVRNWWVLRIPTNGWRLRYGFVPGPVGNSLRTYRQWLPRSNRS